LLLVASELGLRLARATRREEDARAKAQLPGVQAALLGLLALLLGFTMSMAVSRFERRQQLVVEEANAIGTAALRARLLAGPEGDAIAALLRNYVDARVASSDEGGVRERATSPDAETLQQELWSRAVATAQQDPRAVTSGLLLQALNEAFDIRTVRLAVLNNHVPASVIVLICAVAMIGVASVSYGYGLGGRRHVFFMITLSVTIALVVITILDLDRPGHGAIRVSEQAMINLAAQLHATGR
jgi:hypothetical protein